jgi:hypothetical protein
MAGEPETLERKQLAQQSLSEPWHAISKETKNVGTKAKGKARQDLEVLDDFFEGEDSGAKEGTEAEDAEERANVLSVPAEVPARRRRDKSTTRLDTETAEGHSKKAKHKKHRRQATTPPPIIQDSFFGDDKSE